jgi:hypothetical protein
MRARRMKKTITVRLPSELAEWLASTAGKRGISQGRLIREQLEKARAGAGQAFLRLAGTVDGPPDLSKRLGFERR